MLNNRDSNPKKKLLLLYALITVIIFVIIAILPAGTGLFGDRVKSERKGPVTVEDPIEEQQDTGDLGEAAVKEPDPQMMIESETLGIVPANQVGIILAEGLTKTDAQKIADELSAAIVGQIEFINFYQLETKDTTEEELLSTLDKAAAIKGVKLAFPNGAVFPQSTVEGKSCSPLNDPLYTEASNARPYEMIGVQNAWNIIRASGIKLNKVRAGIIDSAIYAKSDNGFSKELYFPDKNGKYPEGKVQIETIDANKDLTNTPETDPKTGNLIYGGLSHCTQQVHIMGADYSGGGPAGITSIAGENVSITTTNNFNTAAKIPAQNIDPNDITQYQGYTYTVLVDLKKQVEKDVKVINLSLGPEKPHASNANRCQAYKLFFEKMNKEHPDVVFVAAAGNEGGGLDGTNYGPGGISLPNVITVGALDQDGDRAKTDDWFKEEDLEKWYQDSLANGKIPKDMTYQAYKDRCLAGSNYAIAGGEVTLSACGTGVPVGLDPKGKSLISNGTSVAAPQVVSAIALMQSINPKLTAAQIKEILKETASSTVERDGKKVEVPANMGSGILRVDDAVLKVINKMRKDLDKDAKDLNKEDLLALATIKLTADGGPVEYTITASVSKVGPNGTDITIETSGKDVLIGKTIQSISVPGKVSWKLTKKNDKSVIKVFRSDTKGCAFLNIVKEENLIHGVVPVKVTAHGIRQTIKDTAGKKIGQWVEYLEFWNVGDAGNGHSEFDDYEIVKVTKIFQGNRYYDTVKQGYVENGETKIDEKSSWKFKGGPNGKFEWWGSSAQSMQVEDGKYVAYYEGSYPPEEDYPIDNPEAFNGWVD